MKHPLLYSDFGEIYSAFGAPNFIEQLSNFTKYISFVKEHLNRYQGKLDSDLESAKKEFISAEWSQPELLQANKYFEAEYLLIRSYNKLLIDASVIQLFSIIEIELNNICERWFDHHPETYQAKEIKGKSNLDTLRYYMVKSIGLNKSIFETDEWMFIDEFRIVRNKLIHREGIISKNEAKEISKLKLVKNKKIELRPWGNEDSVVVVPNIDFVIDTLKIIREFYTSLIAEVKLSK